MFIPNNTCLWQQASATRDIRGERTYTQAIRVPCSVITLNLAIEKTSVRADSSASRGRAEEEMGTAKLLFPKNVVLKEYDLVQAEGEMLEVIKVNPKRAVTGALDHYEVELRKAQT